jgi:Pentapeptide repeats (9 copies)
MMNDIYFYSLGEDLLPLLEAVEHRDPLKYTPMGSFVLSEIGGRVPVYHASTEIPNLGIASANSSVACEAFLVCQVETPIRLWPAERDNGRVDIDQRLNPDSVEVKPAGLWDDVVLQGRIATASRSQPSLRLMKRFRAAFDHYFVQVGSEYVGQQALVLLKAGKRFTNDVGGPSVCDLELRPPARPMSSERLSRIAYEDSYKLVRQLYPDARMGAAVPPILHRRPQFGDEEPLGLRFFCTLVNEYSLDNLTIPRTFFGRSEIGPLSFRNTDLSESTLCWNDFIEVDFTDADLSGCDLRASFFREVKFVRTKLQNADLRRSSFEECAFTDADIRGAKLTREQGKQIPLSDQQRNVIDWQESDGDEPPGG